MRGKSQVLFVLTFFFLFNQINVLDDLRSAIYLVDDSTPIVKCTDTDNSDVILVKGDKKTTTLLAKPLFIKAAFDKFIFSTNVAYNNEFLKHNSRLVLVSKNNIPLILRN
jgi:hypothetical protein